MMYMVKIIEQEFEPNKKQENIKNRPTNAREQWYRIQKE